MKLSLIQILNEIAKDFTFTGKSRGSGTHKEYEVRWSDGGMGWIVKDVKTDPTFKKPENSMQAYMNLLAQGWEKKYLKMVHKMRQNIGKTAILRKPGYEAPVKSQVKILGVQKIWGNNERGKYVFGIPGYTVEAKLQNAYWDEKKKDWIKMKGEFYNRSFAVDKNSLKI